MLKRYKPLIISAVMLAMICCFSACDNRFFGANYEAETVTRTTVISGNIVDLFTGQPVTSGTVRIGGYVGLIRRDGNYRVDYLFGNDENYNAQIPVEVVAPNYLPLTTELQVFPNENRLDAVLEYGAPIVLSASVTKQVVADSSLIFVVETTVFDYQGAQDIDSVFARAFYWNSETSTGFRDRFPMERVDNISANSANFELTLPDSIGPNVLTAPHFSIIAIDRFPFEVEVDFLFER